MDKLKVKYKNIVALLIQWRCIYNAGAKWTLFSGANLRCGAPHQVPRYPFSAFPAANGEKKIGIFCLTSPLFQIWSLQIKRLSKLWTCRPEVPMATQYLRSFRPDLAPHRWCVGLSEARPFIINPFLKQHFSQFLHHFPIWSNINAPGKSEANPFF